ncbi:hypothetical protein AAZX31_13G263100 [Glycine max]
MACHVINAKLNQTTTYQATAVNHPPQKIHLISCGPMAHISDIKLIRTDTTLDLSQKAEKGMLKNFKDCLFYSQVFGADSFSSPSHN